MIPDYPAAAVNNLLSRAGCEFEMLILKNSIRIRTLNGPMYTKVLSVLKNGNVPYYSYDSREKTPVKIVLAGYISVNPSQLADVLAEYNVNPQEIRVISSKETVTGEHVLYLLVFDRGSVKLQDLRQIKSLDGFVVSWRYFTRRPSDAAQCHRCQRFGHGSRNCTLTPKCVKCGETHLTEDCSLPGNQAWGKTTPSKQKPKSSVQTVERTTQQISEDAPSENLTSRLWKSSGRRHQIDFQQLRLRQLNNQQASVQHTHLGGDGPTPASLLQPAELTRPKMQQLMVPTSSLLLSSWR